VAALAGVILIIAVIDRRVERQGLHFQTIVDVEAQNYLLTVEQNFVMGIMEEVKLRLVLSASA